MHSVLSRENIVNPSQFPPLLWFDASDTSTITTGSTNLITAWQNKGTLTTVVLTTGTYSVSRSGVTQLNGKNIVDFEEGVQPGLQLSYYSATETNPWAGNSSLSFFVVAKADRLTAPVVTGHLIYVGNTDGNEASIQHYSGYGMDGYLDTNNANTDIIPNTATLSSASYSVNSFTFDGNNAKLYQNSVLKHHYTNGGAFISSQALYGIDGLNSIAEVVAYNNTSDNLRIGIENYLKAKWGL
jgi:hypothetical protein